MIQTAQCHSSISAPTMPPLSNATLESGLHQLCRNLHINLRKKLQAQTKPLTSLYRKREISHYIDQRIANTYDRLNQVNIHTKTTPKDYIANLTAGIAGSQIPEGSTASIKLFNKICKVLIEQEVYDPPMYSAHDINHALFVASMMENIAKLDPCFAKSLLEKYSVKQEQVLPLFGLVGLLHDIGYPKLFELQPSHQDTHKSTHAILGSRIFADEIASALKETLIESGITENNANLIIQDIHSSIHHHCADSPDDNLKNQIVLKSQWKKSGPLITSGSNIKNVFHHLSNSGDKLLSIEQAPSTIQTRCSDLIKAGDGLVNVECNVVAPEDKPFDTLLRIADNCHVEESRLSPEQKSPLTYQMTKYIDERMDGKFSSNNIKNAYLDLIQTEKKHLVERIAAWAAVAKLNPADWSYRASSLWIDSIGIHLDQNHQMPRLIVDCYFKNKLPEHIPEDVKNEQNSIKQKQITRFKEAMEYVDYPIEVRCHYASTTHINPEDAVIHNVEEVD